MTDNANRSLIPLRYRKRPVEIEAVAWNPDDPVAQTWIEANGGSCYVTLDTRILVVETLEGPMSCTEGSLVIRGVQGEFYPCKSDIFAATYERVHE